MTAVDTKLPIFVSKYPLRIGWEHVTKYDSSAAKSGCPKVRRHLNPERALGDLYLRPPADIFSAVGWANKP